MKLKRYVVIEKNKYQKSDKDKKKRDNLKCFNYNRL